MNSNFIFNFNTDDFDNYSDLDSFNNSQIMINNKSTNNQIDDYYKNNLTLQEPNISENSKQLQKRIIKFKNSNSLNISDSNHTDEINKFTKTIESTKTISQFSLKLYLNRIIDKMFTKPQLKKVK